MPFDPVSMAITQGAAPLLQAGIGAAQYFSGRKMLRNLERPTFEIPEAAKQALGLSQSLAQSYNLPGQANAEQSLNQQYAGGVNNAINTASTSAEALGALTNLNANRMNAQNDIAYSAAQSYMDRQRAVQGQLNDMANWQQAAWDYNKNQPYQAKAAAASALQGSGIQNAFQGLTGVGGAVGGAMSTNYLMGIFGGGADTMSANVGGGLGTPKSTTVQAPPKFSMFSALNNLLTMNNSLTKDKAAEIFKNALAVPQYNPNFGQ